MPIGYGLETEIVWEAPTMSGDLPNKRSGHSFTLKSNGSAPCAYMFGGCDHKSPPGPTNETYKLDVISAGSATWSLITPQSTAESDMPCPRWRHSAVMYNNRKLVIFGGFGGQKRLNDVWTFDTETRVWEQPHPQGFWEGLPQCRGAHTANLLGSKMYVFGGYGGNAYGRADFNDVHALELRNWKWAEVPTEGEKPEARSGHQACLVEQKLFVIGGWNSAKQFDDIFILDLETSCWSCADTKLDVPTWNHSAVSVQAVPNWKIFVFGGSSGDLNETGGAQGTYLNEVRVLDTGSMTWNIPKSQGDTPCPRADSAIAYDTASYKMMLFGGWANRWFGDFYSLNVHEIVGPPYAVSSITPGTGAITGGTMVKIKGFMFKGSQATVRFAVQKGHADVNGTVIDENTIQVESPNFEKYGALQCEVRVSLPGQSLSNSAASFKFHSVSCASKCVAFGPATIPALSSVCVPQAPTMFVMQAIDKDGHPRDCGWDTFDIAVTTDEGETAVEARVVDSNDGNYEVIFTPPAAGTYNISVQFDGTFGGEPGHIRGSPFTLQVAEADASVKPVAIANGKALDNQQIIQRISNSIEKSIRDYDATLAVLKKKIPENDEDALEAIIKIKGIMYRIDEEKVANKLFLDQTSQLLVYMKKVNANVDREIKLVDALTTRSTDVEALSAKTEQRILGPTRLHSDKTKEKIEEYETIIQKLSEDMKTLEFWKFSAGPAKSAELIDATLLEWDVEMEQCQRNLHLCQIFDFPQMMDKTVDMMHALRDSIEGNQELWLLVEEILEFLSGVNTVLWPKVDANQLQVDTMKYTKALKKIPKNVRWCDVFVTVQQQCVNFDKEHPLIRKLAAEYMRPRHWQKVVDITGPFTPPTENPNQPLSFLLCLGIHQYATAIDDICYEAEKEMEIEVKLDELTVGWSSIEWAMDPYKDTDIPLLRIDEETFELLENNQIEVQTMSNSPFQGDFEPQVTGLQYSLAAINETVLILGEIQRSWSYLEPLFIHSEEVKSQLPELTADFEEIDVEVKKVLRKAWTTRNVLKACNETGLFKRLESIVEMLESCKHRLKEFLDGRRRQFPRFYFMSEADLLDILSNGSQPDRLMLHASKIYLATKTFTLQDVPGGRPIATSIVSGVGQEIVQFHSPIALEGEPEIYLQTLLKGMRTTLFKQVQRSLVSYSSMERLDWLSMKDDTGSSVDAAQIILLVACINYVHGVEKAFHEMKTGDKNALKEYNKIQEEQLEGLIKMTQSNINKSDRQRVMALITMDAHGRDIVGSMIRTDIADASSFQWQSQLKHYFSKAQGSFLQRDQDYRGENEARAQVLIADAGIPYDYEYLGNGARLVITPLTDRIYVTATQALNLKMGCAPAGPAGTGKTETTKDLANALGKVCYVFNCSPEMDYKSLGNIFKGLASSGSWGCFDEFNRLAPEVLSVCTVQFKSVCDACKANDTYFILEGDQVMLDPTVGAYITMNPGYLGRSELPEGLKALFRPMTVMVPDLVLICENMLMAEGFTEAKTLASKFYGLYSLLSELLSKQLHYDWGLRAVKSVLCVAGSFKRAEPEMPEKDLLMRALRDFNIPKIVAEDMPIFFGLLGDLFPRDDPNADITDDPPRKRNLELEANVKTAASAIGNTPRDEFMLKVVQLAELLEIRHCVFVMGPASCGKTQTWKTLAKAHALMGASVDISDINPKSVSSNELYGYIVLKTREWKDGLLSRVMRDMGNAADDHSKWIILDGDLDANWIESMNSVMDDNRMLTLASNERVPLKSNMRMIFEIRDLNYATPATVSRAGILYISASDGYQWRCTIDSWLTRHILSEEDTKLGRKVGFTDEIQSYFQKLFDTYCGPTLRFFKKNLQSVVPVEDVTLITNLLNMLDCLLTQESLKDTKSAHSIFVFCCVWAFGSVLTTADDGTNYRAVFSTWWKDTWKEIKLPCAASQTVFDIWLNPDTYKFDTWSKSPYFYTESYNSPDPINQITVPTTETSSVSFWLNYLINLRVPIMVCGPAGTGKTQNVMGTLKKMSADKTKEDIRFGIINFNFYTTSTVLQQTMSSYIEKKTGTNFGPPGKSRLVYFVDDLNLPEVDPYETQSALSLLRQQMEYGHWYDRTKLQLQSIQNTQVVCGMNPTAGSFLINPRLQRHFCTIAIGMPEPPSLVTIYETFLGGHLGNFSAELSNSQFWSSLIKASLALHAGIAASFRKTAANFHYEFNVRHLSSVFQGLIASKKERFNTVDKFVFLWMHEADRVYGDRLVCRADIIKYQALVQAQAKKAFPNCNTSRYFATENAWPLIFCHFSKDDDTEYDQIVDVNLDALKQTLTSQLTEYNTDENNNAMHLDLFDDAIKHVARIVRILRNESGHALLVGVGGMGKRSLARLASHICGYTVKQISISSKYGESEFKDDLRKMHMAVAEFIARGDDEGGVVFMLTDSQITNEKFLIYINDLLAAGEIPDLFPTEDEDTIINMLMAVANTKERPLIWAFFLAELRKRLHLVLCFSPVGDDFRSRARKFPALVNCTVIDWFQPWPQDALLSVGKEKLKDTQLGTATQREGIENFMPFSFSSVNLVAEKFLKIERRHVYTTPKSYLELLQLFKKILASKLEEYDNAIVRLEQGIDKLRDTAETVAILEEELQVKLVAAEEKKAVSSGIAEVVNKEKAKVDVECKKANEEAAKCAVISADVKEKQRSTEADLAAAIPAVEKAMAALDTLNKKDLGECKTMSKPPQGVDDVFSATMVLLAGINPSIVITKSGKVKDAKWDACKKQLLGNIPEYIDYLVKFKDVIDANKVPAVNWREIRSYLAYEHFDPEIIRTKNKAAAGLCNWVVNIVIYYDIVTTVEPKRNALAAANLELDSANTRLNEVNRLVAELQEKLAKLMAEADAANKEKNDAIADVERGNTKMALARQVIGDLSSENVRWKLNVETLKQEQGLLLGDCLLASAFISYIGPFTKPFRDELLNKHWVPFLNTAANGERIPMSEEANPLTILTNTAEIAKWNTETLPADRVSTENGAIVVNSVTQGRRPLIIDPQLQAISWIKGMEANNNLQIIRIGQKRWIDKLKAAIGTDNAFLIENLGEKIAAVLSPVIQRAKQRKGNRDEITIGDTSVPYNDNFRLYLHTKLGNPHYPPEVQAECTMVNFTVTSLGLEDQLLNLVVSKERADLAAKREQLIQDQNQGTIDLKELEDTILSVLSSTQGDITENKEVIRLLSDTKQKAEKTGREMEAAKIMQEALNITSEKYRSIAARGALLFFLMNDLHKVHTYYIYSLAAFTQVFLQGISRCPMEQLSEDNEEAEEEEEGNDDDQDNGLQSDLTDAEMLKRCQDLTESITSCVYNYVRRGLFERDKMTVATMLCLNILLNNGTLCQEEVDYLLLSKSSLDPGNCGSLAEWLPAVCWPKIKALTSLKPLSSLAEGMVNDPDDWRRWFDNEQAEKLKLPGDFAKTGDFHKIILLRAIRPDRVTNALRAFVAKHLGEMYVTQQPFDMSATYLETNPAIPVFFVLFPGVDPTPWVETLGKTMDISLEKGNFVNLSMGQGQEAFAAESLKRLSTNGGWIILQNVHLMQTWLPTLERSLEEIAGSCPHETFRCFISAEPPPMASWKNIPESLMQSCIKVANEAPSDIQSNLRRAWDNFSQERIIECSKPNAFKACLFSLCWFHSIVLGRRRFGQQGWSRSYSFNTGDLTICANILGSYLDNNTVVPWDDLRYIFGEIMYGGHITDAWDRRTNNTYLKVLFNPELLNGMELGPGFKSPDAAKFQYADYVEYINKDMVPEAPPLFGLHPNAEIGYLTSTCDSLCYTIISIGGGGAGDSSGDKTSALLEAIDTFEASCPEYFSMLDVLERAEPKILQEHGPFVVVALQECKRMNTLLEEIKKSLGDLRKGINGQLNMSQGMEDLSTAISLNQVPGRDPYAMCSWEKKAWWSRKSLSSWFQDMIARHEQLTEWAAEFQTPFSMWLPGLFNPTAYTTACLQVTSRKTSMPLNCMTLETHVTTMQSPEKASYYPEDGVFVHGLLIEGARWSTPEEVTDKYTVGTEPATECAGTLLDSNPKELLWSLPVVYVKAVQTDKSWEPSSVGYLRHDPKLFECPVYITRFRGPTYVFLATLSSDCGTEKWVLRGVAILFQDDN